MTTVTGTFTHLDGTPNVNQVRFERVVSPDVVGFEIVTGRVAYVTPEADGTISTSLMAGDYNVFQSGDETFLSIYVPSEGTVDIADQTVSQQASVFIPSIMRQRVNDGSVAQYRIVVVDGVQTFQIIQ